MGSAQSPSRASRSAGSPVPAATGGACGCGGRVSMCMAVDAIDRAVMNVRLFHLGMAARIVEPVMKLALLTCMDARIDPAALLGLRLGDAHVIRNAGGRATRDALHGLAISQALLGTKEVMVMHHTECAMSRFKDAELAQRIAVATNRPFNDELGTFTDDVAAVVEDVGHIIGESAQLVIERPVGGRRDPLRQLGVLETAHRAFGLVHDH